MGTHTGELKRYNFYFPMPFSGTDRYINLFRTHIAPRFPSAVDGIGLRFQPDSPEEHAFFVVIDEADLTSHIAKRFFDLRTPANIRDDEYYYLSVRADRDYPAPWLYDITQAAFQDDKIICFEGMRQHRKVVINTKRSRTDLDIMTFPIVPNPIIVSRRLRDILVARCRIGFGFVPCLSDTMTFTEQDLTFDSPVTHLESQVAFYQLVPTAEFVEPILAGNAQILRRCPHCDTVFLFYPAADSVPVEQLRNAPADTPDLTFSKTWLSENNGPFRYTREAPLIKGRLLRLFGAEKIRGVVSNSANGKGTVQRAVPYL